MALISVLIFLLGSFNAIGSSSGSTTKETCIILPQLPAISHHQVFPGYTFRTVWDVSLHDCVTECGRRSTCLSGNYFRFTRLCQLNTERAWRSDLTEQGGASYFSMDDETKEVVVRKLCGNRTCGDEERCDQTGSKQHECRIKECSKDPISGETIESTDGIGYVGSRRQVACQADGSLSGRDNTTLGVAECQNDGTWSLPSGNCSYGRPIPQLNRTATPPPTTVVTTPPPTTPPPTTVVTTPQPTTVVTTQQPTSTPRTTPTKLPTAETSTTDASTVATTTTTTLSPLPIVASSTPAVSPSVSATLSTTTPSPLPIVRSSTSAVSPPVSTTTRSTLDNGTCENDWERFENHCYRVFGDKTGVWQEAKGLCQREGAHLVSVNNVEEHAFLADFADRAAAIDPGAVGIQSNDKETFWIGGRFYPDDVDWVWVPANETNARPITYWPGQIVLPPEIDKCITWAQEAGSNSVSPTSWTYRSVPCDGPEIRSTMCRKIVTYATEATPPAVSSLATSTTDAPGPCGADWMLFGNDCYRVDETVADKWKHAKTSCENYGADLASADNEDQYNFLGEISNLAEADQTIPTATSKTFWIGGLFDGKYSVWNWVPSDSSDVRPIDYWWGGNAIPAADGMCLALSQEVPQGVPISPTGWYYTSKPCDDVHDRNIICQRRLTSIASTTLDTPTPTETPTTISSTEVMDINGVTCDTDWQLFGTRCYRAYIDVTHQWTEAKTSCEMYAADLASADNDDEFNFLADIASLAESSQDLATYTTYEFWLGGRFDSDSSQWVWVPADASDSRPITYWWDGNALPPDPDMCIALTRVVGIGWVPISPSGWDYIDEPCDSLSNRNIICQKTGKYTNTDSLTSTSTAPNTAAPTTTTTTLTTTTTSTATTTTTSTTTTPTATTIPPIESTTEDIQSQGSCGDDWTLYGDMCYKVVHTELYSWEQAKDECDGLDNSGLITITDDDQYDFFNDLLNIATDAIRIRPRMYWTAGRFFKEWMWYDHLSNDNTVMTYFRWLDPDSRLNYDTAANADHCLALQGDIATGWHYTSIPCVDTGEYKHTICGKPRDQDDTD